MGITAASPDLGAHHPAGPRRAGRRDRGAGRAHRRHAAAAAGDTGAHPGQDGDARGTFRRAAGRPYWLVPGGLAAAEVRHGGQDDADRLREVDHAVEHWVVQHGGGVPQVRLADREPCPGGQQRPGVTDHHRVVVHVGDPRPRVHRPGGLVHRRTRRQPRAEVNELGDPPLRGQPGHAGHELPVVPDPVPQPGVMLQHPVGNVAIGGVVVLAAQPVVVDPRDVRFGRVHGRPVIDLTKILQSVSEHLPLWASYPDGAVAFSGDRRFCLPICCPAKAAGIGGLSGPADQVQVQASSHREGARHDHT